MSELKEFSKLPNLASFWQFSDDSLRVRVVLIMVYLSEENIPIGNYETLKKPWLKLQSCERI